METDVVKRALLTVPRIDKEQWQSMNVFSRWLVASRASVLLMTFTSATVGILMAVAAGSFDLVAALLVLAGLLLAHATNNLLNDYVDCVRGVDKDNYFRARYGTHVLESKLLSKRQMLAYIGVTGSAAIAAGLVLVFWRGGLTLPLMLIGAFFVLFYTWPLKYIGLGEPAVLAVWGPLMVAGSFYEIAGFWSWPVAALGLIYGLAPTAVLFGKHIDKMEADQEKGIHTLPVILGETQAKYWAAILVVAPYPLLFGAWAIGLVEWPLLVCAGGIPVAVKTFKVVLAERPQEPPPNFPESSWPLWYAPNIFRHTRLFSGFLMLGLLVSVFV